MGLSLHEELNNTDELSLDENGKPCEGTRLSLDKKTIYRFHNGMLDGDVYDKNGNVIMQKPAVETKGHVEYWRKNRLHRDKGLPAVQSVGFSKSEFWENGVKIR